MNLREHVKVKLDGFGIPCSIVDGELQIDRPELRNGRMRIRIEDQWEEAFVKYLQAKSILFNPETRTFTHNSKVEFWLTLTSSAYSLPSDLICFSDLKGNSVQVGYASHIFSFAYFDSSSYALFFESSVRKRLLEGAVSLRSITQIVPEPRTAIYSSKGRKVPSDIQQVALKSVRGTLFKIAVEQGDCWSIWKPRKPTAKVRPPAEKSQSNLIPAATYDEAAVSYYKVAKSSPFPSQSFLSYYHVLEYYFLTVSESTLHDRLASLLNDPRSSSHALAQKVISTVRSQDSRADEVEMLRGVLDRFVQEDDLIKFILTLEEEAGEKIYTKKRMVFGESVQITAIKDHAISNAAKVLKHVRNAIVHSSDRYKRDERHVPLSDSEDIILEFIPLVQFFAEKVIFGTAK